MLKELDPLLHSQLRLAVMSILLSIDEADFVYLKEKTGSTSGNVWQLYFGGSFVVVMIVPGHILNAKCKKIC